MNLTFDVKHVSLKNVQKKAKTEENVDHFISLSVQSFIFELLAVNVKLLLMDKLTDRHSGS